MSIYKDSFYDVTVECQICHDLYSGEIQLHNIREIDLVKELLADKIFTYCHHCGADSKNFLITVSNEYFTAEEVKKRIESNTP